MDVLQLDKDSDEEDFKKCYSVLERTIKSSYIYNWFSNYRQQIIEGKLITFYISQDVNRILGAISANIHSRPKQDSHIGYLHVLLKRRWLGTRLLEKTIHHLEWQGSRWVTLVCRLNSWAYDLYKKIWFEDITEKECQKDWLDIKELCTRMRMMRKDLTHHTNPKKK